MRKYLFIFSFFIIQGCSGKIAVMTLEQTIRNAAEAAIDGSHGGIKTINIEVAVTNGYVAGATLPIPVVPINLSASSSVTTKLKMDVDLDCYDPPEPIQGWDSTHPQSVFILDTETGILE